MVRSRTSRLSWRSARTAFALFLVVVPGSLSAQGTLEGDYRLLGKEVRKAFEPLREILQESSAVIYDGWKSMGYGVVVSSDGQILVKASEVSNLEKLSVRVGTELFKEPTVVAISPEWDVALVKVDATDLVPVEWADGEGELGQWVVSNGSTSRSRRRVRVGIISANPREIKGAVPVVLGVLLQAQKDEEEEGDVEKESVAIDSVTKDSGAERAGLQKGDIIIKVEGEPLENREQLLEVLGKKKPGDFVGLTVQRETEGETEELDVQVELSARGELFDEQKSRNDRMSGRVSERRTRFKRVIQHDIGLSERSTGGPLLDLDGRCLGMNIAYANRAETFAIPAAQLREVLGELLQPTEEEVLSPAEDESLQPAEEDGLVPAEGEEE